MILTGEIVSLPVTVQTNFDGYENISFPSYLAEMVRHFALLLFGIHFANCKSKVNGISEIMAGQRLIEVNHKTFLRKNMNNFCVVDDLGQGIAQDFRF